MLQSGVFNVTFKYHKPRVIKAKLFRLRVKID